MGPCEIGDHLAVAAEHAQQQLVMDRVSARDLTHTMPDGLFV
jgi:hypothetical protein